MLIGYTFCIPINSNLFKSANEVVQVHIHNIYTIFGTSICILSDNAQILKIPSLDMAEQPGVEYKICTAPYHPQ